MDAFEEIVSTAQFAVCAVRNSRTSDYALLDFPLPETLGPDWTFVGVLAIVQGEPCAALAMPLEEADASAISEAFVRGAAAALGATEKPKGEVAWLRELYALKDPRD